MKVLLLTPRLNMGGGVAHYCRALMKNAQVDYIIQERGNTGKLHKYTKYFTTVTDYVSFFLKLLIQRPDVVHQNTSLGPGGVKRDTGFMKIARMFNVPTFLFMHGWNLEYEAKVEADPNHVFRKLFLTADHMAVLNSAVTSKLRSWGYDGQITQVTTIVEDELIEGTEDLRNRDKADQRTHFLFMSRVEKPKGIEELIRGFSKAKDQAQMHLHIAGDGTAKGFAEQLCEELGLIDQVTFHGMVLGDAKKKLMANSDAFILPSYTEGLPNSMLESMVFGMPVIITAVGGIPDVFEDGKMGVLLQESSEDLVEQALVKLASLDGEEFRTIGDYNRQVSRARFLASEVSKIMVGLYQVTASRTNNSAA